MRELIVDSFAGGGGASCGIELAIGRSPDIAINHDDVALGMHAANHPDTKHLPHNIWKVDPVEACGGRPVGLLWASPDCKHFSKAKGGKPVKKNIRDLAWVILRWAKQVAPRIIVIENVEEFVTWGPLVDGRPCPDRKGEDFRRFVRELRREGYKVEWQERRACNDGTPTVRNRLYIIARRDGLPIVWPKATHGKPDTLPVLAGKLKPWRTAAEIIDWSLPCPSIFATAAEIMRDYGLRAIRPLAGATMARIAKGVDRYVINAAEPFIVPIAHTRDKERGQSIGDPLATVTAAHRGEQALVTPFVTKFNKGVTGHRADEPLHTVTACHSERHPAGSSTFGVVTPFLVPRYGERDGQEPRTHSIEEPSPVVVPTANGHTLVAPLIVKNYHGDKPHYPVDEPTRTILTGQHHMLVAANLCAHYGEGSGGLNRSASADEPLRTVTCDPRHSVVAAFLAQHNTDMVGHSAEEPVSTIVQKGCTQAVVSAGLVSMKGSDRRGGSVEQPAPTITAQGWHVAETRAFLQKYYGTEQHPRLEEPLHTVRTKACFGIVMVRGEPWQIVDIGMRMLTPRELFRAQGFPDSYVIDRTADGTPITKTDQIRMCGNSVCPQVAAAIVAANYAELEVTERGIPEFALQAAE